MVELLMKDGKGKRNLPTTRTRKKEEDTNK
jgi:hypothetical protein